MAAADIQPDYEPEHWLDALASSLRDRAEGFE